MIVDITGNKNVSKRDVTDFIAHIEKEAFETTGESPNGVLEREELVYFVQHGLALTDEQRETYASRGAFQRYWSIFLTVLTIYWTKYATRKSFY